MATAGQKLSARPFMTTVPADDDYLYIVDDSETVTLQKSKRIKWSVLRGGISASAPVQSVFGRTGTVTALASDYDDSQIDYNGSPTNFTATGTTVAIALDGIDNSLGNLQPLDGNLTDFAGLSPTSDEFIYTVTGAYVLGTFSPFARTLVDDTTAAAMRTTLGLAIGTDVQAWNDNLDDIAALTPTKGNLLAGNGTDWVSLGVGTDTQVLTADSAEASGIKWAAGGGGASLPVADTTSIVEGSADATKEIRIEVDGLTTSTVRVWTAQDTDLTVAGTDVAQSFSALQSFSGTTHAGLRLNNLTTAQRDALTAAEGDIIANTTTNNAEYYNGTSWDDLTGAGGGGSDTLADIATNSTTTAHQTFALDAATQLIIEDSGGADLFTIAEATGATEIIYEDSGTSNTVNVVSIKRHSTGTPSFNFGPALAVFGESDTTVDRSMGRFSWTWGDMTDATRRSKLKQSVYYTTTEQVFLTVDGAAAGTPAAAFAANVTNTGTHIISGTNSATKFQVKDSGGSTIFGVNTTTPALSFGAGISTTENINISGSNNVNKFIVQANNGFYAIRAVTSDYLTTLTLGGAITHTNYHGNTFNAANSYVLRTNMDGSTPTTGFGGSIHFELESSTTENRDASRIVTAWTTATDATRTADIYFETVDGAAALAEAFRIIADGALGLQADLTTDNAPNDDTSRKRLSLQKLSSAPTNAAYIAFSNNPGTDTFYLVLEEG